MSILHKTTLGTPSGKLNHLVFRTRRGILEFYTAPISYPASDSPAAVGQRNNFRLNRKMAAAVDKAYLLKGLWKNSNIRGYASYEKQMSINCHIVWQPEDISPMKLLPMINLFNAEIQSFEYLDSVLRIIVNPLKLEGIRESFTSDISANGVMILTDPNCDIPPYMFIPLTSGGIAYKKNMELVFEISIVGDSLISMGNYRKQQFVICLIIKDTAGIPEYFSVNLSGRIEE